MFAGQDVCRAGCMMDWMDSGQGVCRTMSMMDWMFAGQGVCRTMSMMDWMDSGHCPVLRTGLMQVNVGEDACWIKGRTVGSRKGGKHELIFEKSYLLKH